MSDSTPQIAQAATVARTVLVEITALVEALGTLIVLIWGYFVGLAAWLQRWSGLDPLVSMIVVVVAVTGILLVSVAVLARRLLPSSRLRPGATFDLRANRPEDLIGREEDINDILALIADNRLVFLTGESGVGKSALVTVGLVPRLKQGDRFLPIFVNGYGADCVKGPLEATLQALRDAASPEQRERLGLVAPRLPANATPELLAGLLADTVQHTDRQPLLVFDQLDDYQARHRARFLTNRKAWISPSALRRTNRFWSVVARFLEAGSVHVLFVTRKDTADGLHSVEFVPPESRVLDRVTGGRLSGLLERLAPTGAEPPVVTDPERGWTRLKAALIADLERDGAFLPQQVRVVLGGLARLPALTPARYRRAGGAAGLEELFVRDGIAAATRASDASSDAIRSALVGMVEHDGRELKTRAQPEAELTKSLPDPGQRQKALATLQHLELVRKVPNAERRADDWRLDHDYLARAVLAVDRAANRQVVRLQEGEEALLRAAGDPWRQWASLLGPGEQLRLAAARLRGRFRYGRHRRFALLSALRLVPLLMLGVVASTGVALGVREWELRAEANRIVEDLRRDHLLDAVATRATLRLWSASAEVRLRARSLILESRIRLQAIGPLWILALAGADPTAAAHEARALSERLASARDLDNGALRAVVPRLDAEAAASLAPLLGQVPDAPRSAERRDLLLEPGPITERLDAQDAAREARALREQISATGTPPGNRRTLLRDLRRVATQLDAQDAAREAAAIRERFATTRDANEHWALLQALEAVAPQLHAQEAANLIPFLHERLDVTVFRQEREILSRILLKIVASTNFFDANRRQAGSIVLQILGDPFFETFGVGFDRQHLRDLATTAAASILGIAGAPPDPVTARRELIRRLGIDPDTVRRFRPRPAPGITGP